MKTFSQINQYLPPGISLVSADDFKEWQMDIRILDSNPIYLNKIFRLRFRFSSSYPIGNFSPLASLAPRSPSHTALPKARELRFAHLLLQRNCEISSFFGLRILTTKPPFFFLGGWKNRSSRSNLRLQSARPHRPDSPTHLLQRHHLPRPVGKTRMEPCAERRKCLHEHPKHVDGEYQKRATTRG